MRELNKALLKRGLKFTHLYLHLHLILILVIGLCSHLVFSPSAWAIVLTDAGCVDCHVLPTNAINVVLTHPNLIAGCVTCHSPELLGLHKNGIREIDPLFYNYSGTAANTGCNICHGAPPQAICVGGLVMDHCLDPGGCNPLIFECILCHGNFNGTPAHIYPKILGVPPFAPVASTTKCLACHGLSLFVGRSGAHNTHFLTKLMAPTATSSVAVSIGCAVCHPDLSLTLQADHLTCIPGTSNAWLPGKVPVTFDPLLPQVGIADHYLPGPIAGSGTCYVYCHSNGATPPTVLTAAVGYPGSNLPLPWNLPFPIDPLTLDCGCCHSFPPLTHSATKGDCNQCHPTPVIGIAPDSRYHINGIPDLWKYLAAASPMVPLTLSPTLSPALSFTTGNDTILSNGLGLNGLALNSLGLNGLFGFPGTTSMVSDNYDPALALLSSFGMLNTFHNPFLGLPLANNISLQGLTMADDSVSIPNLFYNSVFMPGFNFGIPGLSGGLLSNFMNPLAGPLHNFSPMSNLYALGGFNNNFNQIGNYASWNYNLPFSFLSPGFLNMPSALNFGSPFFQFTGLNQQL